MGQSTLCVYSFGLLIKEIDVILLQVFPTRLSSMQSLASVVMAFPVLTPFPRTRLARPSFMILNPLLDVSRTVRLPLTLFA